MIRQTGAFTSDEQISVNLSNSPFTFLQPIKISVKKKRSAYNVNFFLTQIPDFKNHKRKFQLKTFSSFKSIFYRFKISTFLQIQD
jgi:hypothetical protein